MRTLGIDYGERRVGVAVSDPLGMLATPLTVVTVDHVKQAVTAIRDLCAEHDAGCVVVGLPLNMDGTRGPMVEVVEAFVEKLQAVVSCNVVTWDERLSTSQVERTLLEADLSRQRRKDVRDKLAAQVILQAYLDAQAAPPPGMEP
jgi:putative Holliday junction resolvase